MDEWKKQAEILHFDKNMSYASIGRLFFPEMNYKEAGEKIRSYLRTTKRHKEKNIKLCQPKETQTGTSSISGNKDGSTTFEGIVALMSGEPITPDTIMRGHNLDPKKWDVIAYKTNFWQAQQKGGGTMLLYQSKITVMPKEAPEIDFEAIDEHFKTLDRIYQPAIILPRKQQGNIIAEVNVADLHIGKLCWHGDTENNYDYKIAREIYLQIIADICGRLKGMPIEYISFPIGNDLVNSDTPNKTTTAGTPQDTDIRWQKLIDTTTEMEIQALDMLKAVAPVNAFYVSSNHDETTTYGIVNTLKAWFRNDERIEIDKTPISRKYRLYGNMLVGYSHGDKEHDKKGNKYKLSTLAALLPVEARQMWAQAKYAEFHAAHIHSENAIEEINGVIVRRISSPTATDTWHYESGYVGAVRKAQTFIYDKEYGLIDTINTPVR